jgi:putative protein kinase ArgK-like GTPase of G3E family
MSWTPPEGLILMETVGVGQSSWMSRAADTTIVTLVRNRATDWAMSRLMEIVMSLFEHADRAGADCRHGDTDDLNFRKHNGGC